MVNYTCECCFFQTDKKSTYENHMKSKKHLSKMNGEDCSDTSSVTMTTNFCDNSSLSRIRELEHKIMMMEAQIQSRDETIRNKDETIKNKDEIIAMLKQQLNNNKQIENNVNLNVKEKFRTKINLLPVEVEKPLKKMTTMEMLCERKNAPSIEDLFDEEMLIEKYGTKTTFKKKSLYIAKYIYAEDYGDKFSFWTNYMCKIINDLPKNERPIYCSNQRLHHFYIKSNNEWIKETDNVDALLLNIITLNYDNLLLLFTNVTKNVPVNPYPCMDTQDFEKLLQNQNERALTYEADINKYGEWFHNIYKNSYFEWIGGDRPRKSRTNTFGTIFMDKEDLKKLLGKVKIALSNICADKEVKYVEEKKYIEEEEEEEKQEYDWEKDPNRL